MITVAEISECFPNNFKPVTGEFVLKHAEALSEHCKVYVFVPLRFFPPRELFTLNVFSTFSNLFNWFEKMRTTKDFTKGNLNVVYFKYFSLPRPFFETTESRFLKYFFYNRLKKKLDKAHPDLIYCHWIRPWADLCSLYADNKNIPFVVDHHEDLPTLKKLFPENYDSYVSIFKKADKIIVHSSLNKTELLSEFPELKNTEVVYLGQNFNVPDEQRDFNFKDLKLICVSHLNEPRKNIEVLIKAFSIIRNSVNAELVIAGEGLLKQHYIKLAEKLNLSSYVTFAGSKSQKELEKLYLNSHIFILPSFPEAFGIVLIEALALGLPVITCKGSGGGEELNLLGYPVVLTEPKSEQDLADAVINLAKDKSKMELMSAAGKLIVKKHFSWELNALQTIDILLKLVKPKVIS